MASFPICTSWCNVPSRPVHDLTAAMAAARSRFDGAATLARVGPLRPAVAAYPFAGRKIKPEVYLRPVQHTLSLLFQWPTRLADGLGLKETTPPAIAGYTPGKPGSPVPTRWDSAPIFLVNYPETVY